MPTLSKDIAALINTGVVVLAGASWLISMPMFARTAMLLLVVFSLAAPTFASGEGGRTRAVIGWVLLVLLLGYMFAAGSAEPGLQTRNEYLGGLNVTFLVALSGMILAFPLGITLALGRTSSMPIFRLLSTAYIETIRGVPLITVLFFGQLVIPQFLPTDFEVESIVRAIIAVAMFAAAYLAENVRGGLQSIPKGQYEAAKAMGMTTAQMTLLITLPQALRAVIPAIVGQAIVLFKDTSLLTIIGITDFFDVARQVVPNQPENLGSLLENLVFAAAVYWIFTFSFSRASLRLEKRLGIGTR